MPSVTKKRWRANTFVETLAVFWVAAAIVSIVISIHPTADAFMICARSRAAQSGAASLRRESPSASRGIGRCKSCLCGGRRPRRRGRASSLAVFEKRPEEKALGDRMVTEEAPSSGVAVEPPSFLKRLFSIPKNVRRTVSAGDVVVPVIGARDGWGGIRQNLANRGIYPGVEYRVLEITVPQSDLESEQEGLGGEPEDRNSCSGSSGAAFKQLASAREAPEGAFDEGRLVFTMRPVYPLVKKLERPWPVQVPAREFPVMLTPFSYNAATAWAALTTSLSTLTVGFVLSQALTFSVIPSHSMEPTLQVNDVVLVEKISRASVIRRNDIVFFNPPPVLRQEVANAGGTLNSRDLFVKRVAAVPGDTVTVDSKGRVQVVDGSFQKQERPLFLSSTSAAAKRTQNGVEDNMGPTSGTAEEVEEVLPESVLRRIRPTVGVGGAVGEAGGGELVSPGRVFVLGDNPAASMDSRVWGQLEEQQIVGHALLRLFPFQAFGLLH